MDPTSDGSPRRDRGSFMVVVAAIVVMAGLMAVALADLGVAVLERRSAQHAADAAALAGATGDRRAAATLAHHNGAVLVSFTRAHHDVTVVVERSGVRARARASTAP